MSAHCEDMLTIATKLTGPCKSCIHVRGRCSDPCLKQLLKSFEICIDATESASAITDHFDEDSIDQIDKPAVTKSRLSLGF